MAVKKKIVDGIEFDADTPDRVVRILLNCMKTKQRIRIFYGDPKTGRDWAEEWDTMGYVGKSTGQIKIPLLIHSTRSYGGGAILTGKIVRITEDKRNLYIHPKYKLNVVVKGTDVYVNGKLHASNFKSHEKALKWASFIKGESNVKG